LKKLKGLLIIATVLLTSAIYAQPGGGSGGGQGGDQQGPPPLPTAKEITTMVGELASEISLTEEQEADVLNLYTEHFAAVKEKTSGNAKPEREEMDALKTDLEKSVKELLSDDQVKGYTAYLKKQESNRKKK
jgi:hypothetical protein